MTGVNEQTTPNTTPESRPTSSEQRIEPAQPNSVASTSEESRPEAHNAPVGQTQSGTQPEEPPQVAPVDAASREGSNISTPTTANPNISNIDGVFTNMQMTSNYPKEMTKVVTTSNTSSQEDILPVSDFAFYLSVRNMKTSPICLLQSIRTYSGIILP